MAGHPLQPLGQQVGLPVLVIDPVHHGVLVGDAPAGDVEITPAALQQPLHADRPVDGHEPGTGLVVWGVEGD